ncbi:hypothetical protein KNN17_11295 [Arthrobacter bambusae]|uniref:hypothetical protein n=1 Tax=Arthrobacter bambusae TaxID=1338426 RepID=UPI001F50B967|nr:hypothetical protein [Arthrobacter bambusae]MCI0142164.1 hypothetical protein [Arthrobacter bambusae]
MIGDAFAWSITERRAIAHSSLRRRYGRTLRNAVDFNADELAEFGSHLRSSILQAKAARERLIHRLEFPFDPSFDLTYLQASGIEDPYAFGLLISDLQLKDKGH